MKAQSRAAKVRGTNLLIPQWSSFQAAASEIIRRAFAQGFTGVFSLDVFFARANELATEGLFSLLARIPTLRTLTLANMSKRPFLTNKWYTHNL